MADRIVVDASVLAGKPAVKGTRLAVDFIIGLMAQGWSEREILANYPGLTEDTASIGLEASSTE